MALDLVRRAIPTQMPDADRLLYFVIDKVYPCVRQLRELYNAFASAANDGSIDIGGVVLRFGTGAPATTDPDGSVYFQIDGTAGTVLWHMETSVWTAIA